MGEATMKTLYGDKEWPSRWSIVPGEVPYLTVDELGDVDRTVASISGAQLRRLRDAITRALRGKP